MKTTWLDKARIQPTGLRRPLVQVELDRERTGEEAMGGPGFATQAEFEVTLAVRTHFWANQAQLNDASQIAVKTCLATINGDLLSTVAQLRQRIQNGDRAEALSLCDDILDHCGA